MDCKQRQQMPGCSWVSSSSEWPQPDRSLCCKESCVLYPPTASACLQHGWPAPPPGLDDRLQGPAAGEVRPRGPGPGPESGPRSGPGQARSRTWTSIPIPRIWEVHQGHFPQGPSHAGVSYEALKAVVPRDAPCACVHAYVCMLINARACVSAQVCSVCACLYICMCSACRFVYTCVCVCSCLCTWVSYSAARASGHSLLAPLVVPVWLSALVRALCCEHAGALCQPMGGPVNGSMQCPCPTRRPRAPPAG